MQFQKPPDRFVRVGTLKVRYWKLGERGMPLLLLHGIGASVEFWQESIHFLARHQRVFAVDLPGHGYTDGPDAAYDSTYFAGFIGRVMDSLKLKRANLLGHSIGGGAALTFAAAQPGRVARLVLVDSLGLGTRLHALFRIPTLPLVGEILARPSRSRIRRVLEVCMHDTDIVTEELVDYYYARARQPGAGRVFLKILRANATIGGIRKRVVDSMLSLLPDLKIPSLLLWGMRDRVLPMKQALYSKSLLPNASAFFVEGSGHMPPLEKPAVFTDVVMKFLSDSDYFTINNKLEEAYVSV